MAMRAHDEQVGTNRRLDQGSGGMALDCPSVDDSGAFIRGQTSDNCGEALVGVALERLVRGRRRWEHSDSALPGLDGLEATATDTCLLGRPPKGLRRGRGAVHANNDPATGATLWCGHDDLQNVFDPDATGMGCVHLPFK